ncbi:hypothetical protein WA158_003720 [Blastocystis sp. Blastoise]
MRRRVIDSDSDDSDVPISALATTETNHVLKSHSLSNSKQDIKLMSPPSSYSHGKQHDTSEYSSEDEIISEKSISLKKTSSKNLNSPSRTSIRTIQKKKSLERSPSRYSSRYRHKNSDSSDNDEEEEETMILESDNDNNSIESDSDDDDEEKEEDMNSVSESHVTDATHTHDDDMNSTCLSPAHTELSVNSTNTNNDEASVKSSHTNSPVVIEDDPSKVGTAVDLLITKISHPIEEWIEITKNMNTHYVAEGTRLNLDRWNQYTQEDMKKEVDMYLVKWRGLSYLHVSWEFEADLVNFEKSTMKQKLIRFVRNQEKMMVDNSAYGKNIYFNPDYICVDSILDIKTKINEIEGDDSMNNSHEYQEVKEYLVKWTDLQYCDATWELYEDFKDDEAIERYTIHINHKVPEDAHVPSYRPPITEFQKIDKNHIYKNNNELRIYQEEGINWLLWNWINNRNSILADEMGLGKTVQSALFIHSLIYKYNIRPPFLIVAPLSTIPHWVREIKQWTDMHIVLLHGNNLSRRILKQYEWKSTLGEFDILLTTYEMVLTESSLLSSIEWSGLIVDEAHRLKGKKSKLGELLRSIQFGCKVLLTGTPLQNNTEELYTLLNFLQPDVFNDSEEYMENYGDLKNAENLEKLHKSLKPFLLRRMKEDVEKSLKPKEETLINVELTSIQKKFYRAVYDRNTNVFLSGDYKSLPSMMNIMMQLRKCCNHPFLIKGVEETVLQEEKVLPTDPDYDKKYLDILIQSSGKLVLLDKLLPKLKEQGHRVLLFSQMVAVLNIIQDYLYSRGYTYERIDGGMPVSERKAGIDRFCAEGSDRFIFLICTRAGGLGINLTAADTVIIFDSDWNPQNDLQAEARCHRIGQNKSVKIYRLVTNRTYEQDMFKRANLKLGLDKAVLNPLKRNIKKDGEMEDFSVVTKKDAESLLKYGAYDFFKDEREGKIEERSQAFCEADIDQILERNSKVITVDREGSSSFSKASFVTNTSDEVDINDPNFWTKYVGLRDITLDPIAPRNRKKPEFVEKIEDDGPELSDENSLEDEGEWTKVDRDYLIKQLLRFGWGQWDSICKGKRMEKHPRTAIQTLSAAIIGQYARVMRLLEQNPREAHNVKKTSGSPSKSSQQSRDALDYYKEKYEICQVILDEDVKAANGNIDHVFFPSKFPLLIRDANFWFKTIKVADRYLKHWSFMIKFYRIIHAYNITLDSTTLLPNPKRAVPPASWWSRKNDLNLIKGTIKHGWGQWIDIYSDTDLEFISEGVVLPAGTVITEKGDDDEEEEEEVNENDDGNDDIDISTTPTTTTPIATTITPTSPTTPTTPITSLPILDTTTPPSSDTKIWPISGLLMRRIRRLVSGLEQILSKNMKLDIKITNYMSNGPIYEGGNMKQKGKHNALNMVLHNKYIHEKWSSSEIKNLRSSIMRWGLPLPPQDPFLNPQDPPYTINTTYRLENAPLNNDTKQLEHDWAEIQSCVASLIQGTQMMVSEPVLTDEQQEYYMNINNLPENTISPTYVYHNTPVCKENVPVYGMYSDSLGPWEFLRIQSKLKQKSISMVQEMCRKIENDIKNKVLEGHVDKDEEELEEDDEKKEKSDEKENTESDVSLTSLVAFRLLNRINLFYDLQSYVWNKDEETIRVVIEQWSNESKRRQDHLPSNWVPEIHDVSFLKLIQKWGLLDWELIWKDPESPFNPICKQKKEKDNSTVDSEDMLITSFDNTIKDPNFPTGLIANQALKRLRWLIEAFSTYDPPECRYLYSDDQIIPYHYKILHDNNRKILIHFNGNHFYLPQSIHVREVYKANSHPIIYKESTYNYSNTPVRCKVKGTFEKFYMLWLNGDNDETNGDTNNDTNDNDTNNNNNNDNNDNKSVNSTANKSIISNDNTVDTKDKHTINVKTEHPVVSDDKCVFIPKEGEQYTSIIKEEKTLEDNSQQQLIKTQDSRDYDPRLVATHRRAQQLLSSVDFPIKIKGVNLISIGQIVTNWGSYHSDKYIWPIGYKYIYIYFIYLFIYY